MPTGLRPATVALYAFVVGVWGTTWIAMKETVATVPPVTATGLRFLVAAPLLIAVTIRLGAPLRYPHGRRGLFALVAVAYFTVPFLLLNLGSQAIASGLEAILFSTVAVLIVAFSVPFLGTVVGPRQWAAITAALAGLAALVAHRTGLAGGASLLGAAAVLGAAVLHAFVYAVLKRDAVGMSPATINALPMAAAGIALTAAGLVAERPDPGAVSASSAAALLYLATVASVGGFLAWFSLLQRLSPVALSFVFVFFPVVAQLVGALSGEGGLGAASLAMIAAILAAFGLALAPERPGSVRRRLAAAAARA
jgi:putative membrane protein PagO